MILANLFYLNWKDDRLLCDKGGNDDNGNNSSPPSRAKFVNTIAFLGIPEYIDYYL